MQKTTFIPILIVFAAAAAFGGYYLGAQNTARAAAELARYQRALEFFQPRMPDEILSVSGEVKEKGEGFLVIESGSLRERVLPGEEPVVETRRIAIDDKTEFVKINPFAPPTPEEMEGGVSREKKMAFADIAVGDRLSAEAGENIKAKLDFTAVKIVVVKEELPERPAR